MGRKHTKPGYNLAVLAGTLHHALRMRAAPRPNCFFSFLCYCKAMTDRLRATQPDADRNPRDQRQGDQPDRLRPAP